jgi:hypothetical protein
MGIRSGVKRSANPHESESIWCKFQRDFQSLACTLAAPRPLGVIGDFATESGMRGEWVFPPPFRILDGFKARAQAAGRSLGAPEGSDPTDFWLDCLFLFIWLHGKREGVHARSTSQGRVDWVIDDVVQVSERLSRWLSQSNKNAVRLLKKKLSEPPPWKQMPAADQIADESLETGGGEVWAAQRNRQTEARANIVQALQGMRIPLKEWPDFVRNWHQNAHTESRYSSAVIPPAFQPPQYDRLGPESIEAWTRRGDVEWAKHRDRFVSKVQLEEKLGLDEKIPRAKKIRGAGSGKTRRNAEAQDRYAWAARRLCGLAWKEIAAELDAKESTVTKAAKQVLRTAGWPAVLSVINAARQSWRPANQTE